MKKFTCREMGGPCDEVMEGETAMEVAQKGHTHIMSTTDEAHAPVREQMTTPSEGAQKKWWDWFNPLWDKKEEV